MKLAALPVPEIIGGK